MSDFILHIENAFTDEFCDTAVAQFNEALDSGFGRSAQQVDGKPTIAKKNTDLEFEPSLWIPQMKFINNQFLEVFWENVYARYVEEHSVLTLGCDEHSIYGNKIKHTPVGGGFHNWHFEQGGRSTSGRLLAYIVYLNDVEEGGETEFYYQHMRVKPKKGSIVLFPAAFTHTHRGNPPLSNDKYIMTGWVEY